MAALNVCRFNSSIQCFTCYSFLKITTPSKAWFSAVITCRIVFSNPTIISILNRSTETSIRYAMIKPHDHATLDVISDAMVKLTPHLSQFKWFQCRLDRFTFPPSTSARA